MSENVLENELGDSLQVKTRARRLHYRIIKRLFDVVLSLCVIAVGLIPGLVLSLFIYLDTKGSPIYTQERIGQGGRPFRIYKFRSMTADSDNVEKYFTPEQLEAWNKEHKVDNDPRITKLGRIIRATSIDEFPQFINVLIGNMSVVGPRPITREELDWFGEDRDLYLSVPMGITGWWQVSLRNDADFESGKRQELELEYARNANLAVDARVFIATFGAVLRRTGR